jgi:5-methyltetrahydrofolate--homocysteine methyltransferase
LSGEFLERILSGEVLVADGAMGTMLMERGLAAGHCPEEWNLTHPDVLEDIARQYHEAGAQIVQTNSFGGSPAKLAQYDLADRTEEINRAAVAAVRAAVGNGAYVSGSCGPTGRTLQPYGDTPPTEIAAAFRRQIQALVDAGVDILCVETMTDLTEANLAIEAAKSIAPSIPVLATMTFDPTPRGFFTIMGVDIPTAAAGLATAGADIIGSNCGNGSAQMCDIAREFKQHTALPLIIQANAGLPELVGDRVVYRESPEFMAHEAREMAKIGVSVIGGCCGTTPAHITAIREMITPRDGTRGRPPR